MNAAVKHMVPHVLKSITDMLRKKENTTMDMGMTLGGLYIYARLITYHPRTVKATGRTRA